VGTERAINTGITFGFIRRERWNEICEMCEEWEGRGTRGMPGGKPASVASPPHYRYQFHARPPKPTVSNKKEKEKKKKDLPRFQL
jgi:hypothetical protein